MKEAKISDTLTISSEKKRDYVFIKINGSLDTFNSLNAEKEIKSIVDSYFPTIIDVSKMYYVSSTGIALFIEIKKKTNKDVVLVNPQENVLGIFKMLGFFSFLGFAKTIELAEQYINREQ